MQNATDFLKSVMIARFRRNSRLGPRAQFTGIFEDLPCAKTAHILDSVTLLGDELPVLASVLSDGDWLFMSTSRIVLALEGAIVSLGNDEIRAVSPDFDACARENEFETYQYSYLLLKTVSGDQFTVHIERGSGFLGIVSVVSMVVERNCRRGRGEGE
jgi:hypothetical protein